MFFLLLLFDIIQYHITRNGGDASPGKFRTVNQNKNVNTIISPGEIEKRVVCLYFFFFTFACSRNPQSAWLGERGAVEFPKMYRPRHTRPPGRLGGGVTQEVTWHGASCNTRTRNLIFRPCPDRKYLWRSQGTVDGRRSWSSSLFMRTNRTSYYRS